MKALHLFPCFGGPGMGGSDYYQAMLTRGLVAKGVEVEVLATRTFRPLQTSAFSISWPNEGPKGPEIIHGAVVRRCSTISPPAVLGRAISKIITNRWAHETSEIESNSSKFTTYDQRARARSKTYDLLAAIGRGPISLGLMFKALQIAKSADVILGGFCPFTTVLLGRWIAQKTGKPFVALPLFHPEDIYHHFENFYRCFSLSNAVLTQTPYSTALIQQLAPGAKTVEIGAGVDIEEFSDENAIGMRFRQQYGLEDKKIVLFVGRKERHKNYQIAVDAIDLLPDDDAVLVMIGADVDGLVINSSKTRYLGPLPRSELIDAYDACELLIFPSAHESFGIVLLEAWLRSKPVLGFAHCGPVASIINDSENGFLCKDAVEFSHRMKQLLQNPGQRREMGRKGIAKVLERYTWDKITEHVSELYREVIAETR